MVFTRFIATCAGRVSSIPSTRPCRSGFIEYGTLFYQLCVPQDAQVDGFGVMLEPRYIVGPEPLDQ